MRLGLLSQLVQLCLAGRHLCGLADGDAFHEFALLHFGCLERQGLLLSLFLFCARQPFAALALQEPALVAALLALRSPLHVRIG